MGESTLTLNYGDLLQHVGRFLGYLERGETYSGLSQEELAECDAIVQAGYRTFLSPPIMPNEKVQHLWSFLAPNATLTTVSGTGDYDLPDDFDGLAGRITIASTSMYLPISVVGEGAIRALRMGVSGTGRPQVAAFRPKPNTGTESARFEMLLHPTPDAAYTLHYPYYVQRNRLSHAAPYPLGGAAYAECIKECCLWQAEVLVEDTANGPHAALAMQSLQAAIAHDRQTTTPCSLGYNSDASDGIAMFPRHSNYVTYKGVLYR